MVVGPHEIPHSADVWVVHETDYGSFAGRSNFFRVVGTFAIGGCSVLVGGLAWYNLDSDLDSTVR